MTISIKELENYITSSSKELKKVKKSPKEFEKKYQEEKSKLSIQRFKGLGEMDAEELWETTMDPERRILRRVRIDEAAEADRIFRILMGDQVEPRRNFIEQHALEVQNLDV